MRQFLCLSVLIVLMLSGEARLMEAGEKSPEIVTSRSEFAVPFRFDQQELTRLNAQKVHLFLSRDRGQTWEQVQTAKLDKKQFVYQANSDGNYWFSVAISDAEQVMHPEPSLHPPGLKLVVDRTKPQLELNTRLAPNRQLQLSWKVADVNPEVASLELDFRNSKEDKWNRVYVKKKLSGRTAWKIRSGQHPEVRGRFTDAAGNTIEKIVKLDVSALAETVEPLVASQQKESPSAASSSTESQYPIQVSSVANKPTITPRPRPKLHQHSPAVQHSSAVQRSGFERTTAQQPRSAIAQNGFLNHQNSPIISQVSQQSLEKLESTRVMNSHQFDIEYQVAGAGPSGISVVELFVTQDNGAQWWRYGVDADLKSPMTVKVPEDGRYGFHFRIHSGVGNAEAPPIAGRKPQIDLVIDSKKPQIQFLKSFQGRGQEVNIVTVQWNYFDQQPSEKPISLFYSSNRQGPWSLIQGDMNNTGTHSFGLPRSTSSRLYFKLRARDAAGNVAETVSEKPLLIDMARPTAHVITVDPVQVQ